MGVFSVCGIRYRNDYQSITESQMQSLVNLAKERQIISLFKSMVKGKFVNLTEQRQALHVSLRSGIKDGLDSIITHSLNKMLIFSEDVRQAKRLGYTGKKFTDIINIGIGGSDLGVKAVYHALKTEDMSIRLHFVSAIDPILMERTLSKLSPETTLVVVSSKSFTTTETLLNFEIIENWLSQNGINNKNRAKHIVVLSANPNAAKMLNLPEENLFLFWSWVGGRFSVWSSVGLPLMIVFGGDVFMEFLHGAHEMDLHTLEAPEDKNLPLQLALITYFNVRNRAIYHNCFLPYDERLRYFQYWLQQLDMESLGKNRKLDSSYVTEHTGQCIWGNMGNESQHSFFQWLREGTSNNSLTLCWVNDDSEKYPQLKKALLTNVKAQVKALLTRDLNAGYFNVLSTLELCALTPHSLGALMALFEHKTVMLSWLFDINAFDQPGVELGKVLARSLSKI